MDNSYIHEAAAQITAAYVRALGQLATQSPAALEYATYLLRPNDVADYYRVVYFYILMECERRTD